MPHDTTEQPQQQDERPHTTEPDPAEAFDHLPIDRRPGSAFPTIWWVEQKAREALAFIEGEGTPLDNGDFAFTGEKLVFGLNVAIADLPWQLQVYHTTEDPGLFGPGSLGWTMREIDFGSTPTAAIWNDTAWQLISKVRQKVEGEPRDDDPDSVLADYSPDDVPIRFVPADALTCLRLAIETAGSSPTSWDAYVAFEHSRGVRRKPSTISSWEWQPPAWFNTTRDNRQRLDILQSRAERDAVAHATEGEPPPSDDPWNDLSDRQRNCLQALAEQGAVDAEHRKSATEIAKLAGAFNDVDSYKKPLADLSRRSLTFARCGRGGGYWLTPLGKQVFDKARVAVPNGAHPFTPFGH